MRFKVIDGYTGQVYSTHRLYTRAAAEAKRINRYQFTYCIVVEE